jgi:DNA mismatch repair protein MutS
MNKLIQQYQQIKAKYKDAILLFRVGNFYETFGEDAKTLCDVMKIALTEKDGNGEVKLSASLPFHSLEVALQKLVRGGHKVAVCEELENPKTAMRLPKIGVADFL